MELIKNTIDSELLNEGFFKDLIKKLFQWNDESVNDKAKCISEITMYLRNTGILSPEIIKLLTEILNSKNNNELDFEVMKRNLKNVLIKKGNKNKNIVKYFTKILNSLEGRSLEDGESEDDYYEPEEKEVSKIPKKQYNKEKTALQIELLKMQEWLKKSGKSVVILFEGRDSAGKGSTIKKFTEHLNPKFYKVITKDIPTKEERQNWFERYERDIEPGKIILFDRSWYNRGIVEPVMQYSSYEEYEEFMARVKSFEKDLVNKGVYLIKLWLSITKETQNNRFKSRKQSSLRYWKYSPTDDKAQEKWDKYTQYKNRVLKLTSSEYAPWVVIDSNDKRISGLNAMRYVLNDVPYDNKNESIVGGDPYPEVVTKIS